MNGPVFCCNIQAQKASEEARKAQWPTRRKNENERDSRTKCLESDKEINRKKTRERNKIWQTLERIRDKNLMREINEKEKGERNRWSERSRTPAPHRLIHVDHWDQHNIDVAFNMVIQVSSVIYTNVWDSDAWAVVVEKEEEWEMKEKGSNPRDVRGARKREDMSGRPGLLSRFCCT